MGLISGMERIIAGNRHSFAALAASLDAMSPLKVLGRGYSIVTNEAGRVLKNENDAEIGERVNIRLAGGGLMCTVNGKTGEGKECDENGKAQL